MRVKTYNETERVAEGSTSWLDYRLHLVASARNATVVDEDGKIVGHCVATIRPGRPAPVAPLREPPPYSTRFGGLRVRDWLRDAAWAASLGVIRLELSRPGDWLAALIRCASFGRVRTCGRCKKRLQSLNRAGWLRSPAIVADWVRRWWSSEVCDG